MIKAYWFNNRQGAQDIIHPDFFTPKTFFRVQAEIPNIVGPAEVSISAVCGGIAVFKNTYAIKEIEQGGIVTLFESADTLESDPELLEIKIIADGNTYMQSIECEYAAISGRTTDFSGNPFPAAVIFNMDAFEGIESGMGVWSDEDGYYSVRLPKGEYNSVFVDDNSYGKTSLEAWGWKMIVDRSETHNFKIGNGEVYSMDVWANNGGCQSLFVFFRPIVLSCVMQVMAQEDKPLVTVNDKHFRLEELSPDISVEDVSVEINGLKIENILLQKIYEITPDGNAMPAYILQCKRPFGAGKQTMVLEYNFKDSKGKTAQSQGRTQFHYTNTSGLAVR